MLSFDVFDDGGEFRHGEAYSQIVDELDALLESRDCGQLSPAKYLSALKDLVARYPEFIDGHAHLGNALMEAGKPKLALQACLTGLELGERTLPEGYEGEIRWGFIDNRPFLRTAHGAALSYIRLGKRKEALQLMEKQLAWNPDDNQGVRFLIGSEYLRAGIIDNAEAILSEQADGYPPYHYELALLNYRRGDYVSAATSLRRGFLANPYIAEFLAGNPNPAPLVIWHGPFGEPQTAQDYYVDCAELWRRTPGALAFVRWLFMHPKIMVERASVMTCRDALMWEQDPSRRRALLDEEDAIRAKIDDVLSRQLVQKRLDRRGREIEPWRYDSFL